MLLVFKCVSIFINTVPHKFILNKAMRIDSLIAIHSLSLTTFPVYGNAIYMNKGKAAKLKLFIAIRESIYTLLY